MFMERKIITKLRNIEKEKDIKFNNGEIFLIRKIGINGENK